MTPSVKDGVPAQECRNEGPTAAAIRVRETTTPPVILYAKTGPIDTDRIRVSTDISVHTRLATTYPLSPAQWICASAPFLASWRDRLRLRRRLPLPAQVAEGWTSG
jgi:hypothetical protein